MADRDTDDALKPGEIRFVDNYIPLLGAGSYTIQVEQILKGSGAHSVHASFTETQEFTVSGPRFRLDPADIQQKYPPPNSQGSFQQDLPHIVLTKRALPWERTVFKESQGKDDRTIPWMALVLFDESEILDPIIGTNANNPGPNPTHSTTIPVSELLELEPDVIVGQYKPDTLDDFDKEQTCQVIDIKPETFKTVMPCREELRFLAHCREVNMTPKAIPGPDRPGATTAPGNGTEWYSVVVGGRFPSPPTGDQAGEVNVAHLISLEGFDEYLDDYSKASLPQDTNSEARIRMVSLASWTFTCLPERGESFSELMRGLVRGGEESLKFRVPLQPIGPDAESEEKDTAEEVAVDMLQAGYVPRSYHTRQGEKTFAWYRGPFTPEPAWRLPEDCEPREPMITAAQAMVYDPDYGLFDLSYAVAWEIGRLLALSDQRFGVLLLNWRRRTHRLIDLLRERIEHSSLQGILATERGIQQFHELLEQNLVSDTFMHYLVGHFAREIEPVIFETPGRRPADPRPESAASINTHSSLADFFHQGDVQQFLREVDTEELEPICDWLAHLYLLYGVPIDNLVAHERLLPPEAIRFFYLDRNWLEVLLDGALSIGIHSSRDNLYQTLMQGVISAAVHRLVHTLRDKLLGIKTEEPGDAGEGPMAGLLVRSAVVSGWPGLEVRAFGHSDGEKGSEPIGLLRMDHLSADVLLCLFSAVPAWIEFNEPKEGLHFGVEVEDGKEEIGLRFLSGDNQVGKLHEPKRILIPETDEHRVLNLKILRERMMNKLGLSDEDEFGPAAFALQMVKVPQQMVFQTVDES